MRPLTSTKRRTGCRSAHRSNAPWIASRSCPQDGFGSSTKRGSRRSQKSSATAYSRPPPIPRTPSSTREPGRLVQRAASSRSSDGSSGVPLFNPESRVKPCARLGVPGGLHDASARASATRALADPGALPRPKLPLDERDDVSDQSGKRHVGALEGGELGLVAALVTQHDRAGVAHRLARRGRLAGHERDDRLADAPRDQLRRPLLLGASDLADEHDQLRGGIGFEVDERFDERESHDRVAPDSETRGLADPALAELGGGLIGERAAAGDNPDGTGRETAERHDAQARLARG